MNELKKEVVEWVEDNPRTSGALLGVVFNHAAYTLSHASSRTTATLVLVEIPLIMGCNIIDRLDRIEKDSFKRVR